MAGKGPKRVAGRRPAAAVLRSLLTFAQDACIAHPGITEAYPFNSARGKDFVDETHVMVQANNGAPQLPTDLMDELWALLAQAGRTASSQQPSAAAAVVLLRGFNSILLRCNTDVQAKV